MAAGSDGVIAQGVEAGGHVRGGVPAPELMERVRAAVPVGFPVLLAGGIADRDDVRRPGPAAAVAAWPALQPSGPPPAQRVDRRHPLPASEESGAHPEYKRRLVEGGETVLTELFGMAWPRAPHRVLPNQATRRWLKDDDPRGPAVLRALHRALYPAARLTPIAVQLAMARPRPRGAAGPLACRPQVEMPAATAETHPLYAGQTTAASPTCARPPSSFAR